MQGKRLQNKKDFILTETHWIGKLSKISDFTHKPAPADTCLHDGKSKDS